MNTEKKLAEIGLKPVEGQNFLTNESIAEALAEAGEIEESKTLEIGGGLGTITEKLAERTEDLTVVEKDRNLSNYLSENFEDVEILNDDFFNIELDSYERCVSNIPFQHSSEIIFRLGEAQIQSALIVQEDLADKLVRDPGDSDFGYFSAAANYYFLPVKLRKISSRCFHPEPEVDAAIIKLYPNKGRHDVENEEAFLTFLKAIYTHKRKKLRNALVDSRNMLEMEKEKIKGLRDESPHSEKRVYQLNIREMTEVFDWFQSEF